MIVPRPEPGLVIRYSYLWHTEQLAGQEEGSKDRPAAIVLTTENEDGETIVTVLPVTHRPPDRQDLGIEIPAVTRRRLGLDDDRSWILLSEVNRFIWPGPDLRPIPGKDISTVVYGALPPNFFRAMRQRLLQIIRAQRTYAVQRTE